MTYDGTTITVTDNFSAATGDATISVVSAINNDADTKDLFVATAGGTAPSPGALPTRRGTRQALAADTITLTAATAGADYNQRAGERCRRNDDRELGRL